MTESERPSWDSVFELIQENVSLGNLDLVNAMIKRGKAQDAKGRKKYPLRLSPRTREDMMSHACDEAADLTVYCFTLWRQDPLNTEFRRDYEDALRMWARMELRLKKRGRFRRRGRRRR